MNKTLKSIAVMGMFLLNAPQSLATVITNGDFANSCSLSGWSQDTDGIGDIGSPDFSIGGSAPNCTADIAVGDIFTSQAWVANTLWQELDLTGTAGSTFSLSMDFTVDSFLTSADPFFIADSLIIDLVDSKVAGTDNYFDENGDFGSLFTFDIDGFQSFSLDFTLDSSFVNQTGWSLEFQMLDTFDSFGSMLSISNVAFVENLAPPASVPEPSNIALLGLAFAGLLSSRKWRKETIRKATIK